MSQCFNCGKKTKKDNILHNKCLRNLFGVSYMPKINLSLADISIKAQEMSGKLSISGVQPKLSMKLNRRKKELSVVAEGGEYILKPQIQTFPNIPQNENLCMSIASILGINVPPHTLIKLKDNNLAYIVKRFDRLPSQKIHQEDFLQILEKKDKYIGSLEEIGNSLKKISAVPGLDVQLFYERVLFFFIIGNGDAHLRNFSILYDNKGSIRLAPAYDIVSSKLVLPNEEDLALSINDKKNKITHKDFVALQSYLGIHNKEINKNILDKKQLIIACINDSMLTATEKHNLCEIVNERTSRLVKP